MDGIEPVACGYHKQVDEPQQLTRLISLFMVPNNFPHFK
jgi:hypothetical protein